MAKVIYLDFRKINKRVINYVKEKRRHYQISADDAVTIPLTDIRIAAERGDATAQNSLGVIYSGGKGVPQDYDKAVKWWLRAAEQGYAVAQYSLGLMYDKGYGVPQDYDEAVKWFRKAAEKGDPRSQSYLGFMYRKGLGVPRDYTEAMKWLRMAAEQEESYAQFQLAQMYQDGEGVTQDYTEAVKWYFKAAEKGDIYGKYAKRGLGRMYKDGKGVPKDLTEAIKWFHIAAEQEKPKKGQTEKDWSIISEVFKLTRITKKILMGLEEGCYIEPDAQYYDKNGNKIPQFGEYVSPMEEREEQWKRMVMSSANNRLCRIYDTKY